jgi:hypothetical protein
MGSGGIAALINLGTRWMTVVIFIPGRFVPMGSFPVTHRIGCSVVSSLRVYERDNRTFLFKATIPRDPASLTTSDKK